MNNNSILVVEDDKDLSNLIKLFCESEGFECFSSMTGKGAIEICENNQIDVVLLDYLLEDTTGDRIVEEIKAVHPGCMTILLDGWNLELEGKINFPCDDVIQKPFLLNDLLIKINNLIKDKRLDN
jgi:DNA-binding response OmpR family regulator